MELNNVSCDVAHQFAMSILANHEPRIDMAAAIDSFTDYVGSLPEPDETYSPDSE